MGAFQFFVRPLVAIMVQGEMTAVEYRETPFYAVMVVWLALAAVLMALILLGAALTDQTKAVRDDAERDTLTGLKVRGPFETQAIAMLQRAREEDVPISVIVADIDHFKSYNDTYGHLFGDAVIKGIAKRLQISSRDGIHAYRFGGEEFALIMPNKQLRIARQFAESLRRSVEKLSIKDRRSGKQVGNITASFGVAELQPGEMPNSIIERADKLLYEAKQLGRNRVMPL